MQATRILDQAVSHAVETIACGHDGALDDGELGGRDRAVRRGQERAFVPHERGEQARPVVRRGAGEDAVEVFRKALRLHQRFAAAVGAAVEVASLRVPAVERADDRFGLHRGFMHGAIPEVDQFLRMPDGPVRAATTFMAVVGAGDGVTAAQGLCKGGSVDGACPATVAFLPVLGVPGGRRRQPEGKLDFRIAARTYHAANVAMGGYRARTRRRRARSGGRRCGAFRHARRRGDERVRQLQVHQVLAPLLRIRSVAAEQDSRRYEPRDSCQHIVSSQRDLRSAPRRSPERGPAPPR